MSTAPPTTAATAPDTAAARGEHEVDLLVLGSGAGGMATAISAAHQGLDTLVVEKAPAFGGSTALSGGGVWIPNNPVLRREGVEDTRESVLEYLEGVTGGEVSRARLEAFADHGPELMELLDTSPHMRFFWVEGYADYHPDLPGGRALGRTIEPIPFDTRKLGEDEQYQQANLLKGPMGLWVTSRDYHDLAMAKRTWAGRRATLKAAWRVASNMVRRRHMAAGGRALAARMRMVMKDMGIPLWLEAPADELLVEDDRVVGAVISRLGGRVVVRARRGVVLATGGFEHGQALRDQWLPAGGTENISAGAASNTGDGITMGQRVGADLGLMDDAWWMPSVSTPGGRVIPLVSERAIPRSVIVSGQGRRFTNEAAPYVNFVHDQLEGGHVPAWFVMDTTARSRYPFAQLLPGQPFPGGWHEAGMVHVADTIEDLAKAIDAPPTELRDTVDRFNEFARSGTDRDFGRGDNAYDRYYGDPNLPNPNLDEITTPPFIAVRIEVGDLGTKGGVVCDEHSRVLRADGTPIPGLYATGNASASVMGRDYAGAGATIGPAMAFGHVAARHAATVTAPA